MRRGLVARKRQAKAVSGRFSVVIKSQTFSGAD